ncbi:MAG: tetratricopeptide repeat protein [Streptosporangiaceae bacterium]|nr:tetratricopeptide repeat protein [Streptosporangiaceae bacterium]
MMALTVNPLPLRLSGLVGREDELAGIGRSLAECRLLTLIGPGGVGKTRLALAAASSADAARQFPAGVCWVDLTPVDDPAIVPQIVAAGLGVPDAPGRDAAHAIAAHIAGQPALIVVDNCEHVAAETAGLAEFLLAVCPALVILATSREPLGVDGERNWAVPPLSLPAADPTPSAHAAAAVLARSDAVRLFEQRARLVRPSFRLTDGNAAAVAQICRRLDGLPLAIELAAARMRILCPAQLAQRLDDIFAVLTGGARSAPPRHQALRATLDWSHDMLGADERAVFRRLAEFAGGFTLDAAEQVAAGDGISASAMLEVLSRLADKSLLQVDHDTNHDDGDTHYCLLATIRDYAAERLAEAGETTQVRAAHLRYYTEFAEATAAGIENAGARPGGIEVELDRLDAELPNLRRAFEYAVESDDPISPLRIACSLDRYAYLRGNYAEVRHWLDTAVTNCPDAPAGLRAKALLGGGRLALLQCDYTPAVRRLGAALRLYRDLGDDAGIAGALRVLGSVAREQGRYARAVELYTESLALAEAAGDRRATATVHGTLAMACWLQCDYDKAIEQATAAQEIYRALGDVEGVTSSLINLGIAARGKADNERSVVLLTEGLSLAEGIGFREGVAWSAEQLGLLAADRGDPAAIPMLRRSLELHTELRDRWRASSVLEDLAAIALSQGDAARTARLLGAAEAIREEIGTVIAPSERSQHESTAAGALDALGTEAFAAARQRGRLASMADLLADLPAADTPPAADASPARDPAAGDPRRPGPSSAAQPLRIKMLGGAVVELGDVTLTTADWGYAKPRELLFLLASSPPMTRDQIGAALWPDLSSRQLRNALHTALRELRRALGDAGWVCYADGQYQLDRARPYVCDVTAFEDALAAAHRAATAGGPGKSSTAGLPDLQRAIEAYGGDFLDGMPAGDWALARRDELRRAFELALLATGRMLTAAGRHQAAAAAFRRAVVHEPLNEAAHRELMMCWMNLGQSARAVRHYHELTDRLRDQLGVAPAAETTALYRKLVPAHALAASRNARLVGSSA